MFVFNMILKIIGVLFILGHFPDAQCQVCTRRSVVTSISKERYVYTYREQYQTNCWYGGTCTKTRIRTNVGYRDVPKREVKNIQVCCDGYMNYSYDDDELLCHPICMPSCKNGYCKNPGECACNEGYVEDLSNLHNCVPQCSRGCDHGTCVAPETCECNFGYFFNITCQPICTEPCGNGECTAPDTCECFEGYRKTEKNICEPYCSKGCENGTCTHPETCTCNEGYVKQGDKCIPVCEDCGHGNCISPDLCDCDPGYIFENGTCNPLCMDPCLNGFCAAPFTCACNPGYTLQFENCVPNCTEDCGNGRCIAPETCECAPGYRFTNSCDPTCCEVYCSKPCIHGSCVEPDVCDCDVGYKKDFDLDVCVPDCPYNCGNGSCVAPNYCECYPGYEQNENGDETDFEESICQPVCKNCEGNCLMPYTCECDNNRFETKHETADGGDCDCFVNCSDTPKQCERTICVIKTTIEPTEIEIEPMTEENEKYVEDGIVDYTFEKYQTDIPDILETEELLPEDYASYFTESTSYISDNDNTDNSASKSLNTFKAEEKDQGSTTLWICVGIGLFLLLISIAVGIFYWWRGGSYVLEGKPEESTSNSIDMRFSTIERNRRDSYG